MRKGHARRRHVRRLLCESLIGCVVCSAGGLFLVGWALHTTNAVWGGISFWCGLLLGDLGMIALLIRHFPLSDDSQL